MTADPSPRPSVVTRVADLVTVACGLLAAGLFVSGGFRDVIGGSPISITWLHVAFVAVAVAAVRHAAVPRPGLLGSIQDAGLWLRARPALADATLAFWMTRPAVLLIGFLAVATFGFPDTVQELSVSREPARALPARWDAQWYAGIAAYGYEWQYRFDRQQNLAFFPAYPILIRGVGLATGAYRAGLPSDRQIARLTWCGLAISLVACFWALWYFARLSREILTAERARDAVVLIAAYPFAIFFSAAYTESVFLLAALGAWHHVRREEPIKAAAWGLVAGLARPNGCFLSIPLGLIALGLRDAGSSESRIQRSPAGMTRALAVAAMPGVGMLLFTAYLHHLTGLWFAWSRMHEAWGRVFGAEALTGFVDLLRSGNLLALAADHPYDAINGLGLVFALAMAWPVGRRLGAAWAIFVLANVLAPLSAGGLLSLGRLTSTLFPLFLALAAVLPSRSAVAVSAGFGVLQGLLAALFFTWRAVY